MKKVLLGYEVGSAEPVEIAPVHLGVTGITRESGKTTALEAMIVRSGATAVVFKTKLGESKDVFSNATKIPMFYKARSDWQYIESLLEATMREDQRFNRSFIRKVCQGTRTPNEVWDNVKAELKKLGDKKEGSFVWSVYYNLDGYFEITLPYLEKFPFEQDLQINRGQINLMDLEPIAQEITDEDAVIAVQSLVIRATLEEIYRKHPNTIIVLPEAADFIPAGKAVTPVNSIAETIARKGGVRSVLLWPDSQDIAGISPRVRGQISTWLLGKQTYEHEVERTLALIPLPKHSKPKTEDIQTLELGHFFLVSGKQVKKVYVLPVWMAKEEGIRIARGTAKVSDITFPEGPQALAPEKVQALQEQVNRDVEYIRKLQKVNEELTASNNRLGKESVDLMKQNEEQAQTIERLGQEVNSFTKLKEVFTELFGKAVPHGTIPTLSDQGIEAALRRILKLDAGEITLERVKRLISVRDVKREIPEYTTDTDKGKIIDLVVKGKLESPRKIAELQELLPIGRVNIANACRELAKELVLLERKDASGKFIYVRHPDVEKK